MRSASFILAGILLFAVGCAGGDSATEDDDAALRAGHATPQPVKPILECVAPGPHHLDVALFGFANESSEQVIIPIGPSNHFLPPGPAARSQPTRFAPGRQHGAFTVPFFERATWRLGLHTATAHRHSPRCSAAETALVQELERIKAHFANRYAERAVVHHFDEVFGFTIDCVDINQQPGLRGTGLTLVRHPTNPPPPAPAPAPGRQVLPRLSGGTDQNGAARMCPPDTVPIRRFALEDVRAFETLENVVRHGPAPGQRPAPQPTTEGEHYSHVGYQAKQQTTHGNAALLTVENPDLDEDVLHEVDHSIAQVWTYAGCQVNGFRVRLSAPYSPYGEFRFAQRYKRQGDSRLESPRKTFWRYTRYFFFDFASSARTRSSLPVAPRIWSLCLTTPLMASRAGPRYLRGSNSSGCSKKTLRMEAVIARRRSVSILTLQTAILEARVIISSGTPLAPGSLPPYLLQISTCSWRTEEAPWRTMGKPGIIFWIFSRRPKSRVGSPLNL